MRVLILEDHRPLNDLIKMNIVKDNTGHIIDQCFTYDDACLMISLDYEYDALIVDIHLQDEKKNGGLFAIKFREKYPDACIHVLTGGDVPEDLVYDTLHRKESLNFIQLTNNVLSSNNPRCGVKGFDEKFNNIENRVIRLEEKTATLTNRIDGFKQDIHDVQKEIRQFMESRLKDLLSIIITVTLVGGAGVLGNYVVLRNMVKDEVRCAINTGNDHSHNVNFNGLRLAEKHDPDSQNVNIKQ